MGYWLYTSNDFSYWMYTFNDLPIECTLSIAWLIEICTFNCYPHSIHHIYTQKYLANSKIFFKCIFLFVLNFCNIFESNSLIFEQKWLLLQTVCYINIPFSQLLLLLFCTSKVYNTHWKVYRTISVQTWKVWWSWVWTFSKTMELLWMAFKVRDSFWEWRSIFPGFSTQILNNNNINNNLCLQGMSRVICMYNSLHGWLRTTCNQNFTHLTTETSLTILGGADLNLGPYFIGLFGF